MNIVDGSIQVVWNCDMGEECINKEEPGKHRGDQGYNEYCLCRGELVLDDEAGEPLPFPRRVH
jgi:hypothetical protein